MKYMLAIDVGTTGVTVLLIDHLLKRKKERKNYDTQSYSTHVSPDAHCHDHKHSATSSLVTVTVSVYSLFVSSLAITHTSFE